MSVLNPQFQQSFPYAPDYSTWDDWNGNLVLWYGQETIPIVQETEWQSIAYQLMSLPTFSAYPVPNPEGFEKWQDWAKEFRLIINGPSR